MRVAQVKCLIHGSGTEIPLLCYQRGDEPGTTALVVPAMPVVAGVPERHFISYFLSGNPGKTTSLVQFDLPLQFGTDAIARHYETLYITDGFLSLHEKNLGISVGGASYSGLYPGVRFNLNFIVPEDTQSGTDGLQLKNRFSFRHPDAPERIVTYEFSMPFTDLLRYSDVDPAHHSKRYLLNPLTLEYSEIAPLAAARNTPGTAEKGATFLEKGQEITNPALQMMQWQRAKASVTGSFSLISLQRLASQQFIFSQFAQINLLDTKHRPLLPAVANGIFKDHSAPENIWALDELQIALPKPDMQFNVSPYRFLFRVKGTDTQGKPVLESEIKVTVSRLRNSLAANYPDKKIQRIPPQNIAVSMSIPYTDNNGKLRHSEIACSALNTSDDRIEAAFLLNNEWSRVAYAALSAGDAEGEKVKVSVRYMYEAYTRISDGAWSVVSLNKIDRIQVVKERPRSAELKANLFVTSQNTLLNTAGLSVKYEAVKPSGNFQAAIQLPVSPATFNIVPQKPQVIPQDAKYKIDTVMYRTELETSFDCADWGQFYQEEKDGQSVSIGCREPYKLGEIPLKLYAEIPQLSTPGYRILRSLQVPNRFVLVPARYVISRTPSDAANPFSATLTVYSTFDVNNPAASHAVIQAALQPDVPHYSYIQVRDALRAYTPHEPELQLISSVGAETGFRWTLPASMYVSLAAELIGDLVNYTLTCTIPNALTLINMLRDGRSGISGLVEFSLPDATSFTSAITINAGTVEGPWMESPLKIEQEDNQVTFENLLANPVDVAGYYTNENDKLGFHPLNQTLQQNQKCSFPFDSTAETVPQYTVRPATSAIAEINTYLENINCQVLFINTAEKSLSAYTEIEILYGPQGDTGYLSALFSPDATPLEVMLPIPLTSYLARRTVRYKMRAKKTGAPATTETGWLEADLAYGNIIDLGPIILLHL